MTIPGGNPEMNAPSAAAPDEVVWTPVVEDGGPVPPVFDELTRQRTKEIIARYPQSRSALLPLLHLVQSVEGHVSQDGIRYCADALELSTAEVSAVATFYTMYKRTPCGEHLVSVCTNTLCGLLGGDEIYQTLSELLGVGMNQTTADGSITLEHAECLAACDYAPVVTVNYEFFDNQTPDSAVELVNELRAGNRPLPSRGAPLCSFREISRQIAGFADTRPAARTAPGSGAPTEVGVRLAQQRNEQAPGYDPGEQSSRDPGEQSSRDPGEQGSGEQGSSQRGSSPVHAERAAADNTGARTGSSAHDEPLETAKSDPAAGSKTGGQSERIEKGE
jgi:NADH-quinone oxidoreductase subunit E